MARNAEETAETWWAENAVKPSAIADLFDEAYAARIAIVDARERAGVAACTLLAMTGVPLEVWPREE